jgi:ABC-type transport system involved in cytochrome bd biosynthesis fused ATPase/permease subunit
MRHPKTFIAIDAVITGIWATLTVFFLTFGTLGCYIIAVMFLMLTLYSLHRLRIRLSLYNWGRPLTEAQKHRREQLRQQGRDYKRYNLYHRLYRFADATEDEYQAEKAKERLKKLRHS